MYAILNNTPSPGYIQWSSVNIQYNGMSYAIADGYTNYTYVYWLAASPGTFVVSDTFPALTAADVLVFLNKSGIAMVVPSATILDGGLIVPGSIYAAALAANTITGNEIAAGAISASELAADAVIAGKIAANAVTAGTVAANAIGAGAIAAGAVTADKIVAGAITGDKIAAATITANKLVAGTITAASGILADAVITNAKIADSTIQSAKIASLDAAKITTGSLDAARIDAGSITVDKLHALAKNLVNNYSTTSDLTGWTSTSGSIVTDATKNAPVHRVITTGNLSVFSNYFEVDPTKTYKVTLSIKCDSTDGTRYFGLHAMDRNGASLSVIPFYTGSRTFASATSNFYFWTKSGSTGGWLDIEAYILGCNVLNQAEVPTGKVAASFCRMLPNCHRIRLRYLNYGTAGTSRTSDYFSPTVTPVGSGEIRAENIVAGTLQSATGGSWISLDNGQFSFGNGALAWNGSVLNGKGKFEAVSGSYTAELGDGAVRFFSSGVEVGQVSTYLANPTGPWLAASAGGKTIDLGKFISGSGFYTAYKVDFGTTASTTATHKFWGAMTLNNYALSCGALTSGAIAAEGIVSCWRVEPHLDNNDRCGTSTKRWQAVHALEGYFNKLTIGSNTCWAAGTMSLTTSSWTTVSFGKTFPAAPRVFGQYTHDFTGDIGTLKIRSITTTSFQATIGGSGFSGISANWFAILV